MSHTPNLVVSPYRHLLQALGCWSALHAGGKNRIFAECWQMPFLLRAPGALLLYDDQADPYQRHTLPPADNTDRVADLCDCLASHCERMDDPWRPPANLPMEATP